MTKVYELQAVATLTMGTSPKGSTYNSDGTGMPLLNGPTEFGAVHPGCTLFTTSPVRTCKAGDLLFCVRGSTTGRMNWADRPYAIGRGVAAIRSYSPLETRYLRYYLEAQLPSLLKRAGGGTFPNLRQADIATFPILWPDNRKEIAAVLTAYDEVIENNTRRIQVLESMAQALYREWFVEFRFPGCENVEIVDSELGPIPTPWRISTLGNEAIVVMGQSPKSQFYNTVGEGLPFHQGVKNFGHHFPSNETYCTTEGRLAEPNDVLISVRAPVGRINVAPERLVIGRGLAASRPRNGMLGYHYWQLRYIFRDEDSMGGGTIFKAITKGDLLNLPWLVPDEATIAAFERIERPIFKLIANLTAQNENLRTTRDLLLPKLVSGEIDVSDLDVDTEWLVA